MAKRKRQTSEHKRNPREERAEIYRRISVRMYSDSKYLALSAEPPSGRGLFKYLITGPHTNLIPGLFSAGRAALAEALGWAQEDFDRCWAEVESQALAQAAWQHRVVWVPNAIKHNEPTSPSVVVSWRSQWPLIPECNLKWTAYQWLRNYLENEKGPAFASAFVSACLVPDSVLRPQAVTQAAPQADPQTAFHQEQEAGAGTGTGAGTGVVVQPPSSTIGFPTGIALVSEAWSEVGMTRDLAISGEPYAFATGRLADGVPAAHLVEALHAAKWFHDEELARSVFGCWKSIVDETPVGGTFHYAKTPWPGRTMPKSGKVQIDDPFAGTPNEFFRPPKPQQRVGRNR